MWRGCRKKGSKQKVALFLSIEGLPRKQSKKNKIVTPEAVVLKKHTPTHTLTTTHTRVCKLSLKAARTRAKVTDKSARASTTFFAFACVSGSHPSHTPHRRGSHSPSHSSKATGRHKPKDRPRPGQGQAKDRPGPDQGQGQARARLRRRPCQATARPRPG